ncbi:hypothetical protein BDV96DRAFT_44840 [Lophiotrema nucula]|uniref:Uncharacterized protein n=1 Tax=Lophiotrema nucula TaxID=690887 RepID=A0A6A5Z9P5_9PLEO|nr:hypothetical protein BDV96DRAFT_44840 [Lophiotrema nucula]
MARKRPDNSTAPAPVKSPMKLPTKVPRKAKHDSTPDRDGGVTDSQEMLALRPYLKKSKGCDKDIHQFRSKVEKDRTDLRSSLQQRLHRAESENQRRCNDIASIISDALLPPSSMQKAEGDHPALIPGTSIARSAAYSPVDQVLRASKKMVDEYNTIEKLVEDITPKDDQQITEAWREEVKNTQRKLDIGHKVALRGVKRVLGVEDEVEENVEGEEEWPDVPLNQELQRTLYYAERGVKRLAKGLPYDAQG